ncbi:MAG: hypothetical protein IKG08_04500 [Eubacterium sp.]|nr:hypothetical protein [Eubacterium sp.]
MWERVQKLKKRVTVDHYPICIEKYRIYADVTEKNKNDASIIQRAKVLKAWTERMPIDIAEDELLVGIGASKYLGLEIDPNYGIWTQDEIDSLVEDGYLIDEQDQIDLQELNKKHNPATQTGMQGDIYYEQADQHIIKLLKAGLVLPPWKEKAAGGGVGGGYAQSGLGLGPSLVLLCPEYDKIMTKGTMALIEQCRKLQGELRFTCAENIEKFRYYQAVILSFEAMNTLADRYSALAAAQAEACTDERRKVELEAIAEICAKVPKYPCETFREAMQCFWFQMLMLSPSTTLPGGRFDQLMYPYYKADLDAGRITRDEALELLCLLRLKDMELNRTSGKNNRKKNAGFAKWHNFLIGGVKADGTDATNDISYMLLDAALITRTPHHTITICVADSTPKDLILKGVECQVQGLSMPAFISDRSYTNFFTMHGVDIEDAREYAITGCLDANMPGKSRTGPVPMTIMTVIFDLMRHNGVSSKTGELASIKTGDFREFKSYEELWEAWEKQFKYCISVVGERNNVELKITQEILQDPLRSALMQNGIESGTDIWCRHDIPFDNTASVCTIGMVNVGDSLAAVKKLVFDEKKYTMTELYDALEADWVGYEDMRKDFLDAPKFGNNDPYVDDIVADCYRLFTDFVPTMKTITGGITVPCGISITSHQPGGGLTGATPDGRKAGSLLADGTMSPMQGCDHCGPVAVMQSAMRVDQDPFQATLLNMKFTPTTLKTDADKEKLASLITTYLSNGGKHVQFNVVSQETLIAAHEKPQEHKDLIIRIAGYSAYFVQLNNEMQEEVINRNSLEL